MSVASPRDTLSGIEGDFPLANLLTAFASSGFTLQAAPARAALGMAAFAVLCGGHGARPAPQDGARGVLPEGAYTRLVERMQDKADGEFGFGRINFVDRSAAVADERERLSDRLMVAVMPSYDRIATGGSASVLASNDPDGFEGGPTSYRIPDGLTCLVAGPSPEATVEDVAGPDAADAGITAVEAFRHALWREVGHCLLPRDPVAAEAFAGLAGIARGDGGRMARAMVDRPVDGDGPDARIQAVLASVLSAGLTTAIADAGWAGIAARADALATRVAPTVAVRTSPAVDQPRPTTVTPTAVASTKPAPVAAVESDDDEPEETASLGFR